MKKSPDEYHLGPLSFQSGNIVMLMGKNIETRHLAHTLINKMYRLNEILDIVSPMAVHLRLPKTWKIQLVVQFSLINLFVTGNRDVDLNTVLKTSDCIDNIPKYDVDTVIGSTETDRRVVYLVK
jgi:hypothetical protein